MAKEKYSDSQAEDMIGEEKFMQSFTNWVNEFSSFVKQKGKIKPNKYRAYGFEAPGHSWANIKDGLRYFSMMIGKAPKNSSPKIQEKINLNKDCYLASKNK